MEKPAIYGSGIIASGLATLLTGNSIPTVIIGRSQESLSRCRNLINQNWDALVTSGLVREENRVAAMKLLTLSDTPSALADRTLVFEAVYETLDAKQSVYHSICRYTEPATVIASTTSSLDVEILAGLTERPEQLLIAHPFQPSHMLPLFEVVRHGGTSQNAVERTCALLASIKRQVVQLHQSVPGFLVNRLTQALFRESIYLIEAGVADAEDIDRAVKYAIGMRYSSIGLLEYFDDVGLTLESTIAKNIYPNLCSATELQETHLRGLSSGDTGLTAGKGLYNWAQKDKGDYFFRKQAPFLESVREWNLPM